MLRIYKNIAMLLLTTPLLWAQAPDDHQLILQLAEEVRELRAEVSRLKGETPAVPVLQPAPVASLLQPVLAAVAPVPSTPPAVPAQPPADMDHDHMMAIPDGPELHFRGFFDVDFDDGSVAQNLQYPLGVPAHSSFRSGEFDLFMTSQLSDKLSFLAETVFASDQGNDFEVDIERFQLTYQQNQYFQISAGRYHSAFGYYNTAYHHGLWFSTATGRPFMDYFEDAGGVLPVHEVGITTTGRVPGLHKLNLHWVAEIGNGSAQFGSANFGDGVQNFASNRNRKDVNFALYARPQRFQGMQVGGSFMQGAIIPATGIQMKQNVASAYVVYIDGKWEFLNEVVLLRHQLPNGGRSYNSPMGYTQISRAFGIYRPYFRFQEVNIPNNDPGSPFVGRYEGPSAGIRIDFFSYAALKLQYNRVYLRNQPEQNGFETQMAFTF
jgi:hypothetical protein